jgi:hypothetical protein
MRPRAIPCNQDPPKEKGGSIIIKHFKGESLNGGLVHRRAIPCNLMRPVLPVQRKSPKELSPPFRNMPLLHYGSGLPNCPPRVFLQLRALAPQSDICNK